MHNTPLTLHVHATHLLQASIRHASLQCYSNSSGAAGSTSDRSSKEHRAAMLQLLAPQPIKSLAPLVGTVLAVTYSMIPAWTPNVLVAVLNLASLTGGRVRCTQRVF